MAVIRAFRGFRYDLGKVGPLANVVAPPYDVIDAALQQQLYDASPYNAIRVELTKDEPGDTEQKNKYTRASGTLKDWTTSEVLRQDTARSLYVYEQQFTVDNETYTRRGFFARVQLEPFGTGRIFPHEQTLSGPKADRLKLYQATGFNISPVFGLYPDETNGVFSVLESLIQNVPPIEAKDHLGVVNRLWVVTDQQAISAVVGLMGPKPIFIADGHHRYETALKYLDEQKAAGNVPDDDAPANSCLMILVGMSDPGLLILPTHRLISGLPDLTRDQLKEVLASEFQIVEEFHTASTCWEHLQIEGTQDVLGFGTQSDGKWLVAKLRDSAIMDRLASEHTKEWRGLAVSILHKLVLEKLIQEKFGTSGECTYVHQLREVNAAMDAGTSRLACLVPPCSMGDVETIAGNRETMPPKSTYFYPKMLTGMVYNSLKKN